MHKAEVLHEWSTFSDYNLMLSPGLRQVLEGLPGRVPFAVEVRDTSLAVVVPDSGYGAVPLPEPEQGFRQKALGVLTMGRPLTIPADSRRVQLLPLAAGTRQGNAGLLVIGSTDADAAIADAWAPMLRAAIEADIASMASSDQQAQRAQHMVAVLRFLKHLGELGSEPELLRATLQAAAVWFDLDARIYRRDAGGDFQPYLYLPAVPLDKGRTIKGSTVDAITGVQRISSVAELDDLGVMAGEALLVPLGGKPAQLLLVLAGAVPPDGELTFSVLGSVVTLLLERLSSRAGAAVEALEPARSEFMTYLEHEVARAARFNLSLVLVLVRLRAASADAVTLVRSALRGLDAVGMLSSVEIGALLVHTGEPGADAVVRRLRERLAGRGPHTAAFIAQAALSRECPTPEALVARARQAEKCLV